MIKTVDELINELEKYRGKEIVVGGMFVSHIKEVAIKEEHVPNRPDRVFIKIH
jgi:hypothetical protein